MVPSLNLYSLQRSSDSSTSTVVAAKARDDRSVRFSGMAEDAVHFIVHVADPLRQPILRCQGSHRTRGYAPTQRGVPGSHPALPLSVRDWSSASSLLRSHHHEPPRERVRIEPDAGPWCLAASCSRARAKGDFQRTRPRPLSGIVSVVFDTNVLRRVLRGG